MWKHVRFSVRVWFRLFCCCAKLFTYPRINFPRKSIPLMASEIPGSSISYTQMTRQLGPGAYNQKQWKRAAFIYYMWPGRFRILFWRGAFCSDFCLFSLKIAPFNTFTTNSSIRSSLIIFFFWKPKMEVSAPSQACFNTRRGRIGPALLKVRLVFLRDASNDVRRFFRRGV